MARDFASAQPPNGFFSSDSVAARPQREAPPVGLRPLLLVAILVSGLIAVHFTPLARYLEDVQALKRTLQSTGVWAPVVLVAASAVLVAFGCPRLVFCAVGGMAFGFVSGLLWSQIGTLLGSYGCFLFVRRSGPRGTERKMPSHPRLQRFLENPSALAVFLARQLPVGGVFVNFFLGLTPVSHAAFLIGSLLGYLPEAIGVTLMASGLAKASAHDAVLQVTLAVFTLAAAGVVVKTVLRRPRGGQGGGSANRVGDFQ